MVRLKAVLCISLVLSLGIFLTSCSNKTCPEYLIECALDNGFVPAYRAYFAINGDTCKRISRGNYESLILGKNKMYKLTDNASYLFNAVANTADPLEWKYMQSKYDSLSYDIETLKGYLAAIKPDYYEPGYSDDCYVYIHVTEFNGYSIIETTLLDDKNTVKASKDAVFYNNDMLSVSENMDLSSIRKIYQYSTDA